MSGQKRRDSQGQGGIRPFQAVKNPFDRFIAFWAVFRSHRTCCRESARLAMGETLSKYDFMTNDAFQSTRPSRGETAQTGRRAVRHGNFNPLAPRGARQAVKRQIKHGKGISIHSPLAGRDEQSTLTRHQDTLFQSTRPSRGETLPDRG